MFLLSSAFAAPRATFEPHVPEWSTTVSDVCASSGLRLEVREDHRAPLVSVVTVVEGGSAEDPPGKEGLAHLAEHLWFRSTAPGGGTVESTLDAFAAHNAFTWPDDVLFSAQAAATDLGALLDIEARRFQSPFDGIPPAVFAAERQVVAQEVRQNRVDGAISDYGPIYAHLFPSPHPYARLYAGTAETVMALTLDDARTWLAEHLRPTRVSLHVAGDVSGSAVQAAILERFPDPVVGVPSGTRPRTCDGFVREPPPTPEPTVSRSPLTLPGRDAKPKVVVAWAVPGGVGVEGGDRTTLAAVLDAATGATCWAEHYRLSAVVACAAEVEPGTRPEATLDGLIAHVELATRPESRSVFGLFWTIQMLRRSWEVLDDAESSISPLATGSHDPFRVSHVTGQSDWRAAAALRVGRPDLDTDRAFLMRWITPARAVRAVVQPKDPPALADTTTYTVGADSASAPGPASESFRQRALPVDPGKVQVRTLGNGLTVQVLRWPGAPVTVVDLRFRGGRTLGAAAGLVDLVDVATSWSPRGLGDDLDERVARAGIRTSAWRGPSDAGFRWTAVPANLADVLVLARSRLADERLDTSGKRDLAEALALGLEAWMADPRGEVASIAWGRLFEGNPWVGRQTHAQWKVAQNLPTARWEALLYQERQPTNSVLTVVGDLDPEQAFAEVEASLGKWPVPVRAREPAAWTPAGPPAAGVGISLVDTGELSTARLAAVCRLRGAANDPGHDVIARLATTLVEARLRDASGLAYDPWAAVDVDPVGGAVLTVGASVAPASVGPALERMDGLFSTLSNADEASVRRAVSQAATNRLLSVSTTRGVAELVASAGASPAGLRGLTEWADGLAAVDAARVRALAEGCTTREEYVVMGPAAAIRPALAAAGRPIREVDWEKFKGEVSGKGER